MSVEVTCACDAARATATVFGSEVPLFRGPKASVRNGLIGIDVETTCAPQVFHRAEPASPYSYRKATIGSTRAARRAGR